MSGRNVIFAKQKIDGFASNASYGGLYTRSYNFPESGFEGTFKYSFTLEAGETYIVVWDGEEFPAIGQDASAIMPGAVALGNCSAFDLDGNNEPFALATIAGSGVTFMSITETVDSHTVVIYQAGGDSLLPDTPVDFVYSSSFGVFAHSEFAPTFGIEAGQKYVIVWDDKKYARTAFAYIYADGSECVGLGNPLAAGQEGNNDPFCVVYDVTHNYLHYMSLEQDTSHTVAVCQLAEGFDNGSVVLPEIRYDGFAHNSGPNIYTLAITADSEHPLFDLVANETYTVYWDGEPYVCVAEELPADDGSEPVFAGNMHALGVSAGNENAPFIIGSTVDRNELADLDDSNPSHSVSIYYGATTGNGDTTALPETALSGFEQDNTGFYGVYFSPAIYQLEAGTEYKVIWDGVEYKVTAIDIGDIMDGFVFAGNGADFIAPDSGEPFAITSYSDSEYSETAFYALRDYDKEHTIAIYYADEGQVPDEPVDPDEEPETREGIILKDRNGKDVAYYGIETVTFDTTTENKRQVYSKGTVSDNMEVTPDFSNGDMNVSHDDTDMVRSVTILAPSDLKPENIRKGTEIAGITGTLIGDTEEIRVPLSMVESDQVIVPTSEEKVISRAVILKPDTLVPENILNGVNIGGVVGNHIETNLEAELIMRTLSGNYYNSNVTTIGSFAFSGFSALTDVSFPECVSIEMSAFAGCFNIQTVSFPKCKSIGYYAFQYCDGLTVTTFPECVSIKTSAFAYCSALSFASLPQCTSIPEGAFHGCGSLTSVYMPECTSIGAGAFNGCNKMESVSFSKCSYVGATAFYYCRELGTADFPACETIGAQAFQSCINLTYISAPLVSSIGASAFSSCHRLSEAIFPECTYLGAAAFSYCSSLTTAYFPKVKTMSSNAFRNCTLLQLANFAELTSVPSYAFYSCKNLVNANFPKASIIYSYAFQGANYMTFVNFDSVVSVHNFGFWNVNGWYKITPTTFPKLQSIGAQAFQYNYNISYLFLSSAKYIGSSAFANCTSLQTVSLPACLSLYPSAFAACSLLTSVYLLGSTYASLYNSAVFSGATSLSIFVRESMLASYKTRAGWTYISSRFVGLTDAEINALEVPK